MTGYPENILKTIGERQVASASRCETEDRKGKKAPLPPIGLRVKRSRAALGITVRDKIKRPPRRTAFWLNAPDCSVPQPAGLDRDFFFLCLRRGANLHQVGLGLLQDHFLVHLAGLRGLLGFPRGFAAGLFFFRRGQGHVVLRLRTRAASSAFTCQRVLGGIKLHALARGVDGVLAVGLVPLRHAGVLVHVLDDVPPADAGVVGAEGDFAQLRRVRE